MLMQSLTCSHCGAPVRVAGEVLAGAVASCRFCGVQLGVAVPSGPSSVAVVLMGIGSRRIETVKCIRSFSGLGLAEAAAMLDRLPATISITEKGIVAAEVLRELQSLGCTASLREESARLPSDPVFAGHQGRWGLRVTSGRGRVIEAVKLVREYSDLGLAEAKDALDQRALVPIVRHDPHEQIQRRFAEIGYAVSFSPYGG